MTGITNSRLKESRLVAVKPYRCTRRCSSCQRRSIPTVVTTLVNNNSRWNSTRPQFHYRVPVLRIDVETGQRHLRLLHQC
jgi:hypothetical protein